MIRSFLLILLVLLVCCGEKVIEAPEDLIAKDKMVAILFDLSLINAAKNTNPKILEAHQIEPMDYIFKKHGIDSLQFVRSDVYYASVPVEYEAIYETVASRLEHRKKELEEVRKKKNDSSRKQSQKNRKLNQTKVKKTARDTLP